MASYEDGFVDEEYAVAYTQRPAPTIRRWAAEGRIPRYGSGRGNVRYHLDDLPRAIQDEWTGEWYLPPAPPLPKNRELQAA